MNWTKVLSRDELAEGQKRTVKVDGRTILLVQHKGELYAVDNSCPHMGASLVDGKISEEGTLICPRHHSEFDLRTGEVKKWAPWPPGVGRLLGAVSKEKPLAVYQIKVEEGAIWVGTAQTSE